VDEFGIDVDVQIGKMEKRETVKRFRQIRS